MGTDGTLAFDSSGPISVGSVISGAGGLAQQGIGVLTLTGHNSYSGTTTISQGTIAASNLGAGGNLGSGAGGVTLGDSCHCGILSCTGTASFPGGFDVNSGGGEIDVAGGQTLFISGIGIGGPLTIGGAGSTSISSGISGTGSLTKAGAGTLTLGGTGSAYDARVAVQNGVLAVVAAGALPAWSVVTLGDAANDSGVLQLGNGERAT